VKLREVFRYEVEYHVRSAATLAYAGFLFLVAVWMFLATGDGEPFINSPVRIAGGSVLPGMLGMLVTAALFGDAAVRDVRCRMDALVYSAPVGKRAYLGGRYLGALAVNAVLLVAIPLGVLAATAVAARVSPDSVLPLRLGAYLQTYFIFLLPNLVLVGAILFTLGTLARRMLPVYLGAFAIFVLYVVALNYAPQLDSSMLASLVDPFGLVTLQQMTRYWTEAEQQTRLIGLPDTLVWNRAFWLLVAGAVLAVMHRTFRFAHPTGGRRRSAERETAVGPRIRGVWPVQVPRLAGSFGFRTTLQQTLAVARNALAEVAGKRWLAVVLLACVGLPLLWGWNVGDTVTVFDTSTWPVTLLITEVVLAQRSAALFLVLVFVFAGELVWKEREAGTAEIVDAAPVPDGVALVGRFLALAVLVVLFQAAAMVGGLLIQALQGYYDFELGLYLRVVFGIKLVDYLLLGALAMTIHVLVDHKHVGHMVVVLAYAFTRLAGPLFGIDHHLLLYGTDPGWSYSDMNGFGPFAGPLVWFRSYWAAWALLLLVLATLFWVRGREPGVPARIRQAVGPISGPVAGTGGVAVVLILAFGGFIFYNTNVLNEYRSSGERGVPQAEYERRYGEYRDIPQPTITRAELRVELYPHEPAAELRGSYRLVNRAGVAIDSVHVVIPAGLEARSLSFDHAAEPVVVDDEVGYRIYALERALAPGDSLTLDFDVAFRPRGFPNSGIQTDVVSNGTSLDRRQMPLVGYQPILELTSEELREDLGLAPRPARPEPEDAAEFEDRWSIRDADLVHVDAVIGTAADQIAVTSGLLRRTWTENGRRYFHYQTEEPISFGGSIFSARYAVSNDVWNDVPLRIFHHREHADGLDPLFAGMKSALGYMTEHFGPYPYGMLRIVEKPRYGGGFGSAHPYLMALSEDAFFSRVEEGEVDQPFYGTAHEVAHTWWGGIVRGAPVHGAAFLSESLANYSAMAITEDTYGPEMGRRVYEFQMERYLRGRAAQGREVPVLRVEDQPYIAYRKGALALWTLREHIGEEAVNAALKRYLEKYRGAGPPYPTSLDLFAELGAVTPDSLDGLLEDWFETITLWDVSTERAVVQPTGAGEYTVILDVRAKKMRADGSGRQSEVPMDDLVQIGVFAPGEGGEPGEPLHLERHRIRSGQQTIRVTVPREPARAGIDPYRMLIDLERGDNLVRVQSEIAEASS
jgi:ABC-type transport system involved in multi-copper enzyme maturation permease subunit